MLHTWLHCVTKLGGLINWIHYAFPKGLPLCEAILAFPLGTTVLMLFFFKLLYPRSINLTLLSYRSPWSLVFSLGIWALWLHSKRCVFKNSARLLLLLLLSLRWVVDFFHFACGRPKIKKISKNHSASWVVQTSR